VAQALTRSLLDESERVRAAAAAALGQLAPDSASSVPDLMRAMEDPDLLVRTSAVAALGRMGSAAEPAVDLLITASLREPEWGAQTYAEALWKIEGAAARAVPIFLKALRDEATRPAARIALLGIGPGAADGTPGLMEALDDPTPELRMFVTRLLGQIGPGARMAVTALIRGLADSEGGVRALTADTLGRIGSAARPAIPALEKIAHSDPDYGIRSAAYRALQRISETQPN
jgi:HEAT repeat protein